MATPINTQFQREAFQELERHLPGTWFKQLHREQGPLYPVLWAIAGALAGTREAIASARDQAIPQTSEGFWLSLHLLSLGLTRRSAETDAQARTRYRFEFSQSRNTREGLLLALTTYSGLSVGQVRLDTNFADDAYGELSLVIDTPASWSNLQWWWLEALFTQWIANGINSKATIKSTGLETLALPPWDFYTRFPTSDEWLAPFWERPAFINELRLLETIREITERSNYSLGISYLLPVANAYSVATAAAYELPIAIGEIAQVPSALSDRPVSRNVLGFACLPNWDDHSLRMAEIWRNLSYTQQPGELFVFLGEINNCNQLLVDSYPTIIPYEIGQSINEMLGYGPWRLRLGSDATGIAITNEITTLPLAGQYWTDSDVIVRSRTPVEDNGSYWLLLEFLLPKTTGGIVVRQLELLLGYDQLEFVVQDGWTVPAVSAWVEHLPDGWSLPAGNNINALNNKLPVRSQIHYRAVNLTIPPDVNGGIQILLRRNLLPPNLVLNFTVPFHAISTEFV